MSLIKSVTLSLLLFLSFQNSKADVRLHALFSDHMVLQQEMVVPIWGKADPGEKVTVKISAFTVETTAGSEGKWMVRIGPLEAGGPFDMFIYGKDTVHIGNILVGEVWVCSGQSNMAMEVRNCLNADQEIASANYPAIRHFQVKRTKASEAREDLVTEVNGNTSWLNSWEICDPSTVGHFSGTAYFFALNLYKEKHIPVGIIHASWGGTTAEAWTPMDTLETDPAFREILRDWPAYNEDEEWLNQEYEKFVREVEKARLEGQEEPLYFNQPSVLFNGIIAPVIPFGIRGVLWYQGESNAYRAYQYRDLFPALISQWRKKWAQGDFPFLFVQLANYQFEPQVFPELREAQTMTLSIPQTAMAVTIDIGDSTDIHPKNKQEVGRRLFLAAQRVAYGEDPDDSGPLFKKMFVEENLCWLLFNNAGDGLTAKGNGALHGFTISGSDGIFVEAQATIDGDQVIVRNKNTDHPVAVRYAWANQPTGANLYNLSGAMPNLPASPFRTDQWPGITSARVFVPTMPSTEVTGENPVFSADLALRDQLESLELYSSAREILNGIKWTYRKQYKGNPFISQDHWPFAILNYGGKRYSGYQINYDLYKDDFILLYTDHENKKYIVLSKDYLESFSFTDSVNREHHYEYFRIPGTEGKEIYEKVYDGKTTFVIRPVCTIIEDPSGSFGGAYSRSYEYFIRTGDRYERFNSKKSLLGLLDSHTREMKKFIRENSLKVNTMAPENIVRVLRYFDEIDVSEN